MASQLFYTNPTVKIQRLAIAAEEAIISKGIDVEINALDQLMLAIFEADDHRVQMISLLICILFALIFVF